LPVSGLSRFERLAVGAGSKRRFTPRELELVKLHYYAQTAWIDDQVGMVVERLEKQGQRSRTLIVLQADHGTYLGEYGMVAAKHTFAPFVHRVPLIVNGPGHVPAGTVCEDVCDSLDVTKTMLSLAGIESPPPFRGRNLFAGRPAEDAAVFATIGFGQPSSCKSPNGASGRWDDGRGWPRRSCVRTRRYRLDKNMRIDGRKTVADEEDLFLADTLADPLELTNLAGDPACAALVRDLSGRLDAHAADALEVPYAYAMR
jgi:choline-sulfatase